MAGKKKRADGGQVSAPMRSESTQLHKANDALRKAPRIEQGAPRASGTLGAAGMSSSQVVAAQGAVDAEKQTGGYDPGPGHKLYASGGGVKSGPQGHAGAGGGLGRLNKAKAAR